MAPTTPVPGLGSAEAAQRLLADGPNALPSAQSRNTAAIALAVLREPMFAMLVATSAAYLVLGAVSDALVLCASILVMIGIAVAQEKKAERALEALRDLSSPRALVRRAGVALRIAGADVVRGDIVLLAEGDRVPADARLLGANDLMIDESLLTGESVPVGKHSPVDAVFSGTLVVKGQGVAEVTATGERSRIGAIGVSLGTLTAEKTTLERETARVVRIVATFAIALSVLLGLFYAQVHGAWLQGVLAGLTLAMAILPEEFPLVLMVFLALGAWRIAKCGVLTRRTPAIEMLGAATVLCVDKTGTLTENRMAVAELLGEDPAHILEAAALACETDAFDPMERAILFAAAPATLTLRGHLTLEHDYPFGDDFLAVCHVWRSAAGKRRIAIKGAAETVLPLCAMDGAALARIEAEAAAAAERGLRLLAVAEADDSGGPPPADARSYRFRWLGFVALADPLRGEVPSAVAQCRRAGIRVVMITGDYPGTARAIARQAGIALEQGLLSGADIHAMDDAQLAAAVRDTNVFARILPEDKLRLVRAFKSAGEVVAMTGDGVNDAPALKASHIGIAMGRRGTDVAREAAALVLTEDNFSSIVASVRLGRRIYQNIRNAMRYLIAVHIPVAGAAFVPILFGWPPLLLPVHVVFLEFVIDPACSVAFEAEDSDEEAMNRPPRDPTARLFDAATLFAALGSGACMLATMLLACAWAVDSGHGDNEVRSLGFAAIVLGNLALILSNRSGEGSVLQTLRRPNRALWWVICGALVALAGAIYVPAAASIFRFAPLGAPELAVALGSALCGMLFIEAAKRLLHHRRARG